MRKVLGERCEEYIVPFALKNANSRAERRNEEMKEWSIGVVEQWSVVKDSSEDGS